MENYFFLEKYVSSEGAVSLNVLYYHQLSIARYQVIFCANNYFEWLPIVSSAFKFRVHNQGVTNTWICPSDLLIILAYCHY